MQMLVNPPFFLGVACFKGIHPFLTALDYRWPIMQHFTRNENKQDRVAFQFRITASFSSCERIAQHPQKL